MILVDTSIWVDHLRAKDKRLTALLESALALTHPFVIGELALGNLRQRSLILDALQDLPRATLAADQEVLQFIDREGLFGKGIGYVDAHLLASVRLTADASLWTRDKHLLAAAERLAMMADTPRLP
ncbi:MAG: type II toxin-antitoxin system VapC family toxin [Methylovirgula sp.]